jgi:HrpA-like RNA helicase
LTQHGQNMAKIPLEPTYAHLLLLSQEFRSVSLVSSSLIDRSLAVWLKS